MTRLPRVFLAFSLLALAAVACVQLGASAGDKKEKKDDAKKEVKKDAKKDGVKKDDKKEVKKDDAKKDKKDDKKIEVPKKEPFKADPALKEFKGHTEPVEALVYSADGNSLASASRDRTIKVWDVASGKEVTLKGSPREVKGVAFLGDRIVSTTGAWDKKKSVFEGEIRIWDVKGGKVEKSFKGHGEAIETFAVSRDGKLAATGSEDQTVIIWDLAAGKPLQTLKGHTGALTALAFSADGKKLVTASADLSVRLWDVDGGKQVSLLAGTETKKDEPKKKEEKKKDAPKDKKDPKKDPKKDMKKDTPPPPRPYTSAAFSANGKIAAGNLEGVIKVWDASGKMLHELKGHEGVWAVAFSPDGSKLATGGWDQQIKIWDVARGKELRTIKAHNHTVTALVFHPKEARLASGGFDGLVKIWELK